MFSIKEKLKNFRYKVLPVGHLFNSFESAYKDHVLCRYTAHYDKLRWNEIETYELYYILLRLL